MNSIISTLASIVINKLVISLAILAILVNAGLSFTETWAKGVLPANAEELLELHQCASDTSNDHLKDVVIASIAKPISKKQALDLLDQCSN